MKATRKRRYHSPLRSQQQEQTRELILEALGRAVLELGPGEYSLPDVALRAGVSVRTVYRHFGGRERLIEALQAHVLARLTPTPPTTLAELLEYPPRLFAVFEEHAPWVEAMLRTGLGAEARAAGRAGRIAHFNRLTLPATRGVSRRDAPGLQAIVKHLVSAETWLVLRRDFGLKGADAGRAVSQALRALVATGGGR